MDPQSQLGRLRRQIDLVDDELLEILAKRFTYTQAIGRIKKTEGRPAADPKREEVLYRRLSEKAAELKLNQELVTGVFQLILTEVKVQHENPKA